MTTAGQITTFPLSSSGATGLTNGPDGNLWFATTTGSLSSVDRITLAGVVSQFDLPSGFSGTWETVEPVRKLYTIFEAKA